MHFPRQPVLGSVIEAIILSGKVCAVCALGVVVGGVIASVL